MRHKKHFYNDYIRNKHILCVEDTQCFTDKDRARQYDLKLTFKMRSFVLSFECLYPNLSTSQASTSENQWQN